jgi:sugar lactone lactonase YvrE
MLRSTRLPCRRLRDRHAVLARLAPVFAAALACSSADRDAAARDSAVGDTSGARDSAATAPSRVASTEGFSTPESVRYDPDDDIVFVSNINGNPGAKDNNGFISRMRGDGTLDSLHFIAGGRSGVTLHAPKGMAIAGDTLWVSDIDAVRGFNKRTGQAIASIDVRPRGAVFLNDVVTGPDGAVYVTDTGIRFSPGGEMSKPGKDRIFRVVGRTVTVVVESDTLGGPNGLAWDGQNQRFIVVPFDKPAIYSWRVGDSTVTQIATGPGGFDGVEVLQDGRIVISSWADSSLQVLAPNGTTMTRLVAGVPSPADIGLDRRRNRIAVPLFTLNRVEFWEIR